VDKAPYQLMTSPKLISGGSLVFSVKAAHDAHLALTRGPAIGGTHYEIFIGGWNNQKCGLRKNGTKPDLAVVDSPNTLTSVHTKSQNTPIFHEKGSSRFL
jgi:Farnesoic acid 0-methyl transferase